MENPGGVAESVDELAVVDQTCNSPKSKSDVINHFFFNLL